MRLNLLIKSKSLRTVNLLGLSVIFASLILSYSYIRKELSYDRFNRKAERLVRFSIQYDENPVDGRIHGFSKESNLVKDIPEIEDIVLLRKISTGVLTSQGKPVVLNDFYFRTSNFFRVFDYRLLQGEAEHVLDAPEKVVISERLAGQLFGDESPLGKEIGIRRIHGASFWTIIRMLNGKLMVWIGIAFLIAVPAAWYVMNSWLENFARKITLSGWIFVFAGLFVLFLSVAAVSWQSWRAASCNPVRTLKSE